MAGNSSVGVPAKVLQEAIGKTISIETKTGEIFRGRLIDTEDNLSCQISEVEVTLPSGKLHQLETVYLRGRRIRLIILPDMLKHGVMFKPPGAFSFGRRGGGGRGRGKSFPSSSRGGRSGGASSSRYGSSPYRRY